MPLYYCGEENRLAGYVCDRDVDHLLEIARPLLLVGDSGTGKSSLALHLAQRISISSVWDAVLNDPVASERSANVSEQALLDTSSSRSATASVTSKVLSSRVLYLVAIDFAREFASSIDSKDMPRMRERIDSVEVLVIDDLHMMAEKGPAQDELASRLEARDSMGKVTIVTCRRLPSEIRGLRPSLVSRTLPGLTVTLQPPSGDARRDILRELVLAHLPDTEPEMLPLLDAALQPDLTVRELDAMVKQIALWCRMNESSVCPEAIDSAINNLKSREPLSIKAITSAVARQTGVKSSEMRSGSRRQNIVRARSLAMWLSRQLTDESLTKIGDAFGGRDHSTVLHAIRKIETSFDEDASLRRTADQITQKLSAA